MLRERTKKTQIAKFLNVSTSTLYRYMDERQIDYRTYYTPSKTKSKSSYLKKDYYINRMKD